jgi:hypothetical protein
MAAIA